MAAYIPEDNLSYPVLIKTDKGSGSGFFFNHLEKSLYLVTAKHVLYDIKLNPAPLLSTTMKLTAYDKSPLIAEPMELVVDLTKAVIKASAQQDITVVELANLVDSDGLKYLDFSSGVTKVSATQTSIVGVPNGSLKKMNDVLVSNEVFIIGYPNSLGMPANPQIDFDRPLLRKGIIAGKNTKNSTIILDCPSYQGNSGGLAIEVDEDGLGHRIFHIIGIVTGFIPFIEQFVSLHFGYKNQSIENSGYSVVVPVDAMLDLINEK